MNNGADAADQIVNMTFKGIEVLAKISGEGAKNLATYLYAVLKGQKRPGVKPAWKAFCAAARN